MSEIALVEYFGMGEAIGIVATVFVLLYFSRRQIQSLSVDIETKILNDLDEKIHGLTGAMIDRPELIKIISNIEKDWSPEVAFSYHILYTFAYAFHMRQRNVLSDNEWLGWLRWMKTAFERGTISELWKSNIEAEKWFDPAFQEFVDKELIPVSNK